jgi:hypothetical protein
LRQVHNPNLHDLDRDLSYRVVELGPGYYGDTLRIVSANANLSLGHAALQAAVKQNRTGAGCSSIRAVLRGDTIRRERKSKTSDDRNEEPKKSQKFSARVRSARNLARPERFELPTPRFVG